MANLTITIDDDLLKRARLRALERNTWSYANDSRRWLVGFVFDLMRVENPFR